MSVAPRVRRVGRETDRERERAGGVKEREDARENRLLEHERILDGAAFEFEVGAIGVGAETVPRIKGVVGVAGATQEEIAIEGDAMVGVDEAVGVDEGCLGVEDETVEVEDKGADHAEGGRVEPESVRVRVKVSERVRSERGERSMARGGPRTTWPGQYEKGARTVPEVSALSCADCGVRGGGLDRLRVIGEARGGECPPVAEGGTCAWWDDPA